MSEFVKTIAASEIPKGQGRVCDVRGKPVAIFNVDGSFCAIENTCPHRGGPLGEGDLEGNIVTCPWHGWQFDVTTGVSPVNPAAKVKKLSCKVEGTDVLVEVE